MERRVSTGRAAQLIGCTSQHVRNLIDEGKLEAYSDTSGRWRVSVASVERYIEQCRKRAADEKANSANAPQ